MAVKSIKLENEDLRYRLYFLKQAYDKMRLYVELCEDEIGWLGYVEKLPDEAGYVVTDVFLVEQEVHSTTTELSPDAIINYYNNLEEDKREEFLKKCKLWGHSHVNMAPSPSGQDESQGEELSKDAEDFYIRLITNKKGDYNITFYDKVIKAKIVTDDIILYSPEGIELRKQIKQEIEEKVKKKTIKTTYGTGYKSYGGSYSSYSYNYKTDDDKTKKEKESSKIVSHKKEVSKIDINNVFEDKKYDMEWLRKLD